jgi:meiosis-specific protein HOP1
MRADGALGRRFATFKLFYYDEAPDNYEPPFFVPADATKDKFFFATHAQTEMPEKVPILYVQLVPRLINQTALSGRYRLSGNVFSCVRIAFDAFAPQVLTRASSISISIASIASIIPSGEDDSALYYGLQNAKTPADNTPSKSFYEASQSLQHETAIQLADAHDRNVVWDADSDAANALNGEDAEGEPDPLYPHLQDRASMKDPRPLGIRQPDGSLVPYSPPVKRAIIKSKRQDERSVNFNSQTSSKLVCCMV